ncbi:type II CAAX endopeptidase family protein [Carnobacterium maltaromaticum]|uniref:Type II CAAX endopeptidase family protein n=1 Tax=Carnobacterium maltaromaticum TaxID=2751 RepID=A0AAW9JL54_CARML|nr:type II CAAX endopeptidase family protein [Carnobacterium maltaromaticum]MDZ5757117.1 type II CAAX endopeptidase family protein [Carnobacterium maltaromaticum]
MLKLLKTKEFWLNCLFLIALLVINFIPSILFGVGIGMGLSNSPFFPYVVSILFLASVAIIVMLALKRKIITFKWDFLTGRNLAIIFIAFFLMKVVSVVIAMFMTTDTTANQEAINQLTSSNSSLLMAVMIVIAAPINEEIIFRASITQLFFKKHQVAALIVTSVVFGLFHGPTDIQSFLLYSSMGAALSAVYLKTGRIECSIALHFLNNGLSFVAMQFI